jgi:hypothetical protein
MKHRLKAPSPALVISLIALFVALGGTSLAATSYISGVHIKPHTIAQNRLTKRAIKSLHGAKGAQGNQGVAGKQGAIGPSNGYFDSESGTSATLSLPAGAYALSGVAGFFNPNTAGQDQAGCSLEVNGQGTVTSPPGSATIPNNNGYAQITDQGVAHLPVASQILNSCYDTSSGTTVDTAVTAIKLSTASP